MTALPCEWPHWRMTSYPCFFHIGHALVREGLQCLLNELGVRVVRAHGHLPARHAHWGARRSERACAGRERTPRALHGRSHFAEVQMVCTTISKSNNANARLLAKYSEIRVLSHLRLTAAATDMRLKLQVNRQRYRSSTPLSPQATESACWLKLARTADGTVPHTATLIIQQKNQEL